MATATAGPITAQRTESKKTPKLIAGSSSRLAGLANRIALALFLLSIGAAKRMQSGRALANRIASHRRRNGPDLWLPRART